MLQNFAVILTSAVLLLAGATSAAPPKSTAVSTDVTTPPKPVKSHIRTSAVSTDYTLGEVLEDQPNLELLYKLYQARPSLFKQLENDINDGKPITFLAPSDDAFRKLIEGSSKYLSPSSCFPELVSSLLLS